MRPEEFLVLTPLEKSNIKRVRVEPGELGSRWLGGRLVVELKRPVFTAAAAGR
jgi:hypothetical protein